MAGVRRFTPPLIRSIAAPFGRMVPARSFGQEPAQLTFGNRESWLDWSPFGAGRFGTPPQGNPPATGLHRTMRGTNYNTPISLYDLARGGSRSRWFNQSNLKRPPAAKLAIGRGWTTTGLTTPPLVSLPPPGPMMIPRIGA